MPVDPVPTTPTRFPSRSTPSWGHRAVWYHSPSNVSRPSKSGVNGSERQPTALTKNRVSTLSPSSVSTVQVPASSSYSAAVTAVSKAMSRRRSSRSAANRRYSRISGPSG